MSKNPEERPPKEAEEVRDKALFKALNTPPKPKAKTKKGPQPKKPRPPSAR